MKIKERLRLNTWFSLGAIVLMLFTLGWSFREVYRADRNVLLTDEMRKVTPERIFLRDDYLLNRNERAKDTMDIIKTKELTESGFDFLLKLVVPRDLLKKVREVLDR